MLLETFCVYNHLLDLYFSGIPWFCNHDHLLSACHEPVVLKLFWARLKSEFYDYFMTQIKHLEKNFFNVNTLLFTQIRHRYPVIVHCILTQQLIKTNHCFSVICETVISLSQFLQRMALFY